TGFGVLPRRLLSGFLAFAVVSTSSVPAVSQDYIFRHKYPLSANYVPPVDDGEIAPENDVVAWYVAAVGRTFFKTVPVETTEVAEWRVVEGDVLPGISLDTSEGAYEGIAATADTAYQEIAGFDSRGNKIARARVNFRSF